MISAAVLFAVGCYAAVHAFSKWNAIEEANFDDDSGHEFGLESGLYRARGDRVPLELSGAATAAPVEVGPNHDTNAVWDDSAFCDLEANIVPPQPVHVGNGPLHPTLRPGATTAPNLDLAFEELEIGDRLARGAFGEWNAIEEANFDDDSGHEFGLESGLYRARGDRVPLELSGAATAAPVEVDPNHDTNAVWDDSAFCDLEANIVPPQPVHVGNGPLHPTLRPGATTAPNLDLAFEELEIGDRLARGAFGEVHRGLWKGTPVAVKMFIPPPAGRRDLEDQLASEVRAEATILAGVQHPNVCIFMGACMAPPNRALVMELVSPGSLWEALREDSIPSVMSSDTDYITPTGFWPWPLITKVAEGIARGMAYLHGHKPYPIVHRDLKSANVLVDGLFNPKICDFGLSTFMEDEGRGITGDVGTAQWMAPEVLANLPYDQAVDVYSFGVVCWELLTREVPYKDLSQRQVAHEVLDKGLRPVIPQWCPQQYALLIKMAWRSEADRRPSFADVMSFFNNMPHPPRASDTNV